MIFQTSIRRELMRSFSAALFVLVVIMVTMMLIRTLGFANRGLVSPSEVSLVLGYTVLAYFPTILTLSLFISLVYVLSRMYRDSEMAVWFTSGQGLFDFLKPLFAFAWPIVLLAALLSLAGWPWANSQIVELRNRYQTRGDLDRIAPGQFQESSDGNRVFYVDNNSDGSTTSGKKLFVFAREPKSEVVLSAHSGRIENQDGGRFVVLNNGQTTEILDDQTLSVGRFKEYGIRIGNRINTAHDSQDPQALLEAAPHTVSTPRLLQLPGPRFRAELGWRLGMALAGINFLLIGLGVTHINPRSGRSGSLIFALLSFAAYYNLINAGQSWVAQGKISLPAMLVLLHGGVFAAAMLWLWMRHRQWSWRDVLLGGRRSPRMAEGGR